MARTDLPITRDIFCKKQVIHPTQSKVLWTKERHDTWLQTSKHYCYASSTQNL